MAIELEKEARRNKRNQGLMHLVRRAHGLVENPDIEKHRQSQNYLGAILSNTRDIGYREMWTGCTGNGSASTGHI